MSRYAAANLADYPVTDILDPLDYEATLTEIKGELQTELDALSAERGVPQYDTLMIESESAVAGAQVLAGREMKAVARVNDKARSLTLSGALGRNLDHIGLTYYRRTLRLEGEDNETYRARLAVAPESWSCAGPEGANVYWGYSASSDILDLAIYSVDEGCALPAIIRYCVLSKTGDGTAPAALINTVKQSLSKRDRMPTADHFIGQSASRLDYMIAAELQMAPGVMAQPYIDAATARLTAWATGKRRWAGDNVEGPVWMIGRSIDAGDIKAVAWGGDANVLGVRVISPAVTVNPPAAGYAAALAVFLNQQTDPNVVALSDVLTAHLFKAPRCTSIIVTARPWNGDI